MRVALVSQEYPPGAHGGIGSQTYLKAHGLAARGHEVSVISYSFNHEVNEFWDGPVRVIGIPGFENRLAVATELAQWITYSAEVAVALAELHERTPLDIVDFPEWGCEGYLHLLNQTEWNHIPTVIQLHGPLVMLAHTIGWPEIDSEFYRVGTAMEGACLRLADAVFSSSRCSADWCARHYGLAREGIPILHTGVDSRLFSPRDLPKDSRPTIIFVGSLRGNKRPDLLLEAACRLAGEYPDLRLQMIGQGEEALIEELKAKARAAGLGELLDLPGFIERQELPAYLSRAHIFAAPSTYEGGPGFVYLEAMACGLPVVACAGSGAAEVVIHEHNGLLVPPGDVDALVNALGRLLANREEREAMGARARRYVLAEADSETCIKRIEAFYLEVVAGRYRRQK